MQIITNNKARQLLAFIELPAKAQSDFDYLDSDSHNTERFIHYRGAWYDTRDTQSIRLDNGAPMGWAMVVQSDSPLAAWHAIISETFFSGVVFRFVDDGMVVCGRYFE